MALSVVTCWYGETADLVGDYLRAVGGADQIVTVDNATPYATMIALRSWHEGKSPHRYVRNADNVGFAAGNNQGYGLADRDVIVFLNSDIAGAPDLPAIIANDVRDGYLYGPSLGQHLVYGRWIPYLEGWCVAATRATWDRLILPGERGPWAATAMPGLYWEDNDICLRALQAGIGLVQTVWPIEHKGGMSAGPLPHHAETYEANRAVFVARCRAIWGGDAG